MLLLLDTKRKTSQVQPLLVDSRAERALLQQGVPARAFPRAQAGLREEGAFWRGRARERAVLAFF